MCKVRGITTLANVFLPFLHFLTIFPISTTTWYSSVKNISSDGKNYKLLLLLPHCHHIIIICIYFSFASHVFTDNLFYSYLHGGKTFSSSLILPHSATDISAISQHHFHIDNWRTCAMYEVCHLSFDINKVNVFHVTTSK